MRFVAFLLTIMLFPSCTTTTTNHYTPLPAPHPPSPVGVHFTGHGHPVIVSPPGIKG